MNFKQYLTEANRNLHIEHLEDLIILHGMEGFELVKTLLGNAIKFIDGEPSDVVVSAKTDGSPSLIHGTNPSNGQFFVSTKSLFNKKQKKINYQPGDIHANHQGKPGLERKLMYALKFLPELGFKGVVQSDILFTDDSVTQQNINGETYYMFKANTVTYGIKASSELGKKLVTAKIGICPHTSYIGDSIETMQAVYRPTFKFNQTPRVLVISPYNVHSIKLDPATKKKMEELGTFKVDPHILDIVKEKSISTMFLKFVNMLVREGKIDSIDYKAMASALIQFFETNGSHVLSRSPQGVEQLCDAFLRVALIKKLIVLHLLDGNDMKPFIQSGGSLVPSHGEGFVIVYHNIPYKLVLRNEFSKANFNLPKDWDNEKNT